jgi:hypothetical protein
MDRFKGKRKMTDKKPTDLTPIIKKQVEAGLLPPQEIDGEFVTKNQTPPECGCRAGLDSNDWSAVLVDADCQYAELVAENEAYADAYSHLNGIQAKTILERDALAQQVDEYKLLWLEISQAGMDLLSALDGLKDAGVLNDAPYDGEMETLAKEKAKQALDEKSRMGVRLEAEILRLEQQVAGYREALVELETITRGDLNWRSKARKIIWDALDIETNEQAQALAQTAEAQVCRWVYNDYSSPVGWFTECGNRLNVARATIRNLSFEYCPFCGRRLEAADDN